MISSSNIIVISAENYSYFYKCLNNDRILDEYINKSVSDLDKLISLINKISTAKIIIIGNKCINKNIEKKLNNSFANYNYINIYDRNYIKNLNNMIDTLLNY